MMELLEWIVDRASEASTWAGLAAGAAAVGMALQSDTPLWAAVLMGAVAVVKKG